MTVGIAPQLAKTILLQVNALTRTFGSFRSLDEIGFALHEGRCTALLGPNGAGKTTLIRILTGLLKPSSGSVSYPGIEPGGDIRNLIGYLPQTPAFYGWMTGREFLLYAAGICGVSKREAALRAGELLERVGLGAAAGKRRIAGYSGGMKQRLGLAQALIHRPKLLILDEPVSALDPIGRREVMELLRGLKRETTVLFSTHVLHDAEELCDDVIILQGGRISVNGAIGEILSRDRSPILSLKVEPGEHAQQQLAAWLQGLSHPVITSAVLQPEGNAAKLHVLDAEEARTYLLRELLDQHIPLTKLEIGHASLEDVFREAVKSE